MNANALTLALALATVVTSNAQTPDNLVAEGIPAASKELKADVGRYLEFRSASFSSWHPVKRELLIATRFADAAQLHEVRLPGGARRQLTFTPEPARGGAWQRKHGRYIYFSQDIGGGEFYQFHRLDPDSGRITLLTDGKSRNEGGAMSSDGELIAYTSTRRNGRDYDIYVMDPSAPASNRMISEMSGGGWAAVDWSEDKSRLLVAEYISINKSRIYLMDVKTGTKELLTPDKETPVAYTGAEFARDGKSIFFSSDDGSEFQRLYHMDLKTRTMRLLPTDINWDVDEFDVSPDSKTIAFVTNEDGVGKIHLIDVKSGRKQRPPHLPLGIPSNVSWHENGHEIAFNFTSARSPADVYSYDVKSGQLDRWTESETGGLQTGNFVEPELVRVKSFDGLTVSGFLYRPDPKKFPGRRPLIINIHGGPESQSRPNFLGRNNYYLDELGVAVLLPNVRGSSGYGKTFLTLDNGFKREDSVKDIGAFLDWAGSDAGIDAGRIAVMGGSYGGYMTLACMTHFSDRLRCGVDVVGISSFLTFLKNTQDYRRDLRRVEYGDERDPKMAEFMAQIAPLNNVEKIGKPLFVVQGLNDPRVPVTEAEQMAKAIRDRGGKVWYLMAKDEGHGFQKKKNADFQFISTIQFFKENLVN
jgi:dipeptidyl aminopeptidase/acylaminoacyl peptidase